ncbi:MAG: ABC transporter ATP-binding protein/permease [Candidatus Cloacimonetes bacterium]|nr:ABC transporter ATP-binding protein/permease [Candidatus Cloacimonadota bacterium]MDY0367862.1 ABC transporter ATP-binding protein [Candidatus Syntrophosphaera sp.]
MDNATPSKASAWPDLRQIYAIMFRYWPLLVSGLLATLLYAIFSGISVTLVIPLFDYVFKPASGQLVYTDLGGFLGALGAAWSSFWQSAGGVFSLEGLAPLWEEVQKIMLATDSLALLYALCLFVVVVILLKNIFFYLQRVLFIKLRGNTIRDLREKMFARYMGQSLEFFHQNRVGDAMVRMVNDAEIVSESFIKSLLEGILDIFTILVFMRVALLLSPRLFLYGLLVVPFFTLFVGWLGKKIKKNSQRIQAHLSTMFSTVEEALNSMKIVKAFRREDSEHRDFSRVNSAYVSFWKRAQYYSSLSVPLSELNTVFTAVIVIILGGRMILAPGSGFSLGDFTAFLFAIFSLLHPLKNLTQIYSDVKKALVSLNRVFFVLNREATVKEDPDALAKDGFSSGIEFDRVSFSYSENRPVLRDVSLTVRKGEKIAIVGASGGGKTTLVNLFNRMYDVSSGAIRVDGTDIRQLRLADLRRLFGVVTQDSVLFTRSIRANIAYGSLEELDDAQIRAVARIAHAEAFILQFPAQYDEVLQTKGANLSGGQKQRLCIARAIVGDPPVLIFDEATSALDTESEQLVQEAIDAATQNRTVIIIAHRLSTVLKADRIVVLEEGRIVGQGSHEELLRSCPRYRKLHAAQYQE